MSNAVPSHPANAQSASASDAIVAGRESGEPPAGSPRPRKLRALGWLPRRWVFTRGDARRRVLYLTFDDGPDPQHTPRMLDLLARHGARATFFVIGENAERHPDLMRRIVAEGHRLGNHSWNHPYVERLDLRAQRAQIDRTDRLLQDFDGRARHDFRPPRGAIPGRMLVDCVRRGIRVAYWSYDSLDYSHRAPDELVAIARREPLHAGDVVLMHDDSPHSHALLDTMIPEWQAQGFALEPLDDGAAATRQARA